ncbi:MAG TPA: alkaline phosphatase family protein [Polyangia bacterium]|nr:alkaline phosphatase family protein [Polyangia bacterium]
MKRISILVASLLAGCGGRSLFDTAAPPSPVSGHVIQIDIDDHGLAGLWMAKAPNLKGLIARGVLAYSRVDVPTHSNQNNMTLLTGQYPEGHDVPSNAWLSRALNFASPVNVPGLSVGDYALYDKNPLRTRGDSVYRAVRAAGGRTAYVGELPPFEVGADDVHLSIVGVRVDTALGDLTLDADTTRSILGNSLGYPQAVTNAYHYDGLPGPTETPLHFTLRDAAAVVRATDAAHPMPAYMFVWDFIALDDDPTSTFGADGPALAAIIDDYDDGLGQLLAALTEKNLLASTNIVFTLDHGKVDTHSQVALGTHGATTKADADGQLGDVVRAHGADFGLTTSSYALLNEDGDALLYARTDGAGTAAGAAAQTKVAHALVDLVQSGALVGVDATRTMTADGYHGTRAFHDFRVSSPNQADVVVFPKDDWTLNQVDAKNTAPGPFKEHTAFPYARHGGFTIDELYVPLIMAGPAFKQGVLLPHPVEHADVAPTALATLRGPTGATVALATAARGPIRAALAGDAGETIALPSPPESARDLVLTRSGFGATPRALADPPTTVVLVDVAGLYDEEAFDDPATAGAATVLRTLTAFGTRFEDCWTRSRDWPVTEYQALAGGYPISPWVAAAEDDPTQTFAPGAGLLAMPPPAKRVANMDAYAAWRQAATLSGQTVLDAARALGFTTALVGKSDFQSLHVAPGSFDTTVAADGTGVGAALTSLMAHPRLFALVSVGSPRTADRHSAAALDELHQIAVVVADLASRSRDALFVVTSRGATTIDDPGADFYGPGTSRHVPLLLIGPGVRAGVVSDQPASPADLPATILFGIGAPVTTDFATGTWATGAMDGVVPQPTPNHATEGHALLRAYFP